MKPRALVLFDGVCNLCNSSVQFIIKRDTKAYFSFSSIQDISTEVYPDLLNQQQLNLESILLVENNKLYKRSTAALRIVRKLNGLWPILYAFIILPKFIRDPLYNYIARNRYRWFGKKDQCMIPSPEIQSRFL